MAKDLEVRHCRVLLAVHEHGGVGAAARALGVAQSTVSETLLSLERLLGAPVTLRRPGQEAALAPAAEALLPHARALVAASEAALAAVAGAGRPPIRLGAVESISSYLLPGPLAAFRHRWPEVEVRVAIGLCEDLRKRVGRAELDAALTIEGPDRVRGLHDVERLASVPLRLVVSPAHPLAHAAALGRRDLGAATFLLADHEGAFNEVIAAWTASASRPPRRESAGSIDGVKRGVLGGDAIGVLPDYAVAEELAVGALIALDLQDPPPPVALFLTTPTAPMAGSPLESLVAEVREGLQGDGKQGSGARD